MDQTIFATDELAQLSSDVMILTTAGEFFLSTTREGEQVWLKPGRVTEFAPEQVPLPARVIFDADAPVGGEACTGKTPTVQGDYNEARLAFARLQGVLSCYPETAYLDEVSMLVKRVRAAVGGFIS